MPLSMFNTRVPLPERDEVFLMNTFTDAQLVVSSDVAALMDRVASSPQVVETLDGEVRSAIAELTGLGFLVESREAEQRELDAYFMRLREDTTELRATVLTTLQCNFACGYCFQGDHGDDNKFARKMSLETAVRVSDWLSTEFDLHRPTRFGLSFFGGEPLLNLPVMYEMSERLWRATQKRNIGMHISIITNGLLLTPDVVDRLLPFGLTGVKITLDGDHDTHDRMRPLRGGQGTFDRIIENIRRVAHKVSIAIGGNFDESTVDSFPALLDFLRAQNFASQIGRVAFKPAIREKRAPTPTGMIPLAAVDSRNKPLNGTCMTSAGAGTSSPCDSCHFVDEKMSFLREETKKHGFETLDGVHMGPCQIHRRHAYTVGTDGSLYACPGFTGEPAYATGHIDGREDARMRANAGRFEALAAWRNCGDCSFIPVCGGGCSVASHTELGDINRPACHKTSFEAALISLARDAASAT